MHKQAWKSSLSWWAKSDIGIAFLLVNVVGMGWVALLTNRPIPPGFEVCVGVIFGGKTIHGVVTYDKKKGGGVEEGDEDHG